MSIQMTNDTQTITTTKYIYDYRPDPGAISSNNDAAYPLSYTPTEPYYVNLTFGTGLTGYLSEVGISTYSQNQGTIRNFAEGTLKHNMRSMSLDV